jgi:sensor c-di-GMP phosphodiesterase-like protein
MISKGKGFDNRVAMPINQQEISEILRMHQIEEALRLALEKDKLDVYLQPIYCIKSDMFVSAEALVRFTDEKMGIVKLMDFIQKKNK